MTTVVKNIVDKIKEICLSSPKYELENFFCGFGNCKIENEKIIITDYKFKPSKAYPKIILDKNDITSITIESSPPQIRFKDDWIFVSAEQKENLKVFIENNNITESEKNWTWDKILDPFLDTKFTKEEVEKTLFQLEEIGVEKNETLKIRKNVSAQMYKYNFDTMLWEWCSLGLSDVLQAMRVKLSEEEFEEFYKNAMAIENKNVIKQK